MECLQEGNQPCWPGDTPGGVDNGAKVSFGCDRGHKEIR